MFVMKYSAQMQDIFRYRQGEGPGREWVLLESSTTVLLLTAGFNFEHRQYF